MSSINVVSVVQTPWNVEEVPYPTVLIHPVYNQSIVERQYGDTLG